MKPGLCVMEKVITPEKRRAVVMYIVENMVQKKVGTADYSIVVKFAFYKNCLRLYKMSNSLARFFIRYKRSSWNKTKRQLSYSVKIFKYLSETIITSALIYFVK